MIKKLEFYESTFEAEDKLTATRNVVCVLFDKVNEISEVTNRLEEERHHHGTVKFIPKENIKSVIKECDLCGDIHAELSDGLEKIVDFSLGMFYPKGDWRKNKYITRKSYQACLEQIVFAVRSYIKKVAPKKLRNKPTDYDKDEWLENCGKNYYRAKLFDELGIEDDV